MAEDLLVDLVARQPETSLRKDPLPELFILQLNGVNRRLVRGNKQTQMDQVVPVGYRHSNRLFAFDPRDLEGRGLAATELLLAMRPPGNLATCSFAATEFDNQCGWTSNADARAG